MPNSRWLLVGLLGLAGCTTTPQAPQDVVNYMCAEGQVLRMSYRPGREHAEMDYQGLRFDMRRKGNDYVCEVITLRGRDGQFDIEMEGALRVRNCAPMRTR